MKQRLIGAAVLVAVAVIFLPALIKEPAPDSAVSELSFRMPPIPDDEPGNISLPLVSPAGSGEVLQGAAADEVDAPTSEHGDVTPSPEAASDNQEVVLPPVDAAGKYVVHFASFATQEEADLTARGLQARGLPVFTEDVTLNRRPAVRVRIGPYRTQAEAEIVRVQAAQVRPDIQPRVFMLIDDAAAERVAAALEQHSTPSQAAASGVGFVVQLGAFSDPTRATHLQERLRQAGIVAFTDTVNTARGRLTRVNAGPVSSRREADQLKTRVKAAVDVEGVVRAHP